MADMWVESFKDISEDVFIDACRLHREGSLWYPTMKEIIDRCKDVWEARQRETKMLSEPIPDLSPEQIAENIAKLRAVIKGV